MQIRYIAALHPDPDAGGFSVTFPDVPEIATEGDTLAEAVAMARDALDLVVESMREEDEALPEPGNDADVVARIVAEGAYPHVIEIETADEAVRVNVSMPASLVPRIDRRAEEKGQSRSGFIAEAVREALRR